MKIETERKQQVSWRVIENLLDKNYTVYLTDIFKVWIKRKDQKKEIIMDDLYENFIKTLKYEIRFFNPGLIITYGNSAFRMIDKISLVSSINILSLPHPAPTANGKWRNILQSNSTYASSEMRCTKENKIKYINKQIDKKLNKNSE